MYECERELDKKHEKINSDYTNRTDFESDKILVKSYELRLSRADINIIVLFGLYCCYVNLLIWSSSFCIALMMSWARVNTSII